jgi:hypothetical protein
MQAPKSADGSFCLSAWSIMSLTFLSIAFWLMPVAPAQKVLPPTNLKIPPPVQMPSNIKVLYVQPGFAYQCPTQVVIRTSIPAFGATSAVFGSISTPLSAGAFSPDGLSVTASAPLQLGTVPVSLAYNGQIAPSSATFSCPLGEMDVTGPAWYSQISNIPCDPAWTPGDLYYLELMNPVTLYFNTLEPNIYISTLFQDDSNSKGTPPGPPQDYWRYVGNEGKFLAELQICSLQPGSSYVYGSCKNWDGHQGSWVEAPVFAPGWSASFVLPSSGAGKTTQADLVLPVLNVFSPADLAATFRIQGQLWQWDTSDQEVAITCRNASATSAPFDVVVAPAAAVQLDTLPYTILYQPPGDMSTASFTATTTYGTQFSLASSNEVDNSWGTEQSSSTQFSLNETFFGVGLNLSDSDTWDQTTMETFGTTNSNTNNGSSSAAFGLQQSIPADNTLIPGSGLVCAQATSCATTTQVPLTPAQEPFWDDTFYLLVHPQFFVWVLGGQQDQWVMYGAVPTLADIEVGELDACVQGKSWYGLTGCQLSYGDVNLTGQNGQPPNWTTKSGSIFLSVEEAKNLLALDPFYAAGQGASLSPDRASTLPSAASVNYGGEIGVPHRAVTLPFTNTEASQNSAATQTSTSLSVTTVWGSTTGVGLQADIFSLSSGATGDSGSSGSSGSSGGKSPGSGTGGLTFSSGFKDTDGFAVKTSFQNSTAVSNQLVTTITVTLDDADNNPADGANCTKCHNPLPHNPSAAIFFDKVFGTYMFVDPDAPANYNRAKLPVCCTMFINSLYRREIKHPRFSDVPANDAAVGAIGLMARINVLPGNSDGTFRPKDPLTRGQLATAIARALKLPLVGAAPKFSDVKITDAAAPAIAAVTQRNLVPVSSQNAFGPSDPVTRQDFAVSLANAFKLQGVGPSLTDSSAITPSAKTAVSAVLAKGYLSTTSADAFQPTATLTRKEAAQALFLAVRDYSSQGSP